jgi:hypothetical protein
MRQKARRPSRRGDRSGKKAGGAIGKHRQTVLSKNVSDGKNHVCGGGVMTSRWYCERRYAR